MAIPDRFNCPSCFESFFHSRASEALSDEQMRLETVQPPCTHTYHRACFVEWIANCNDPTNPVHCPTCRGAFSNVFALVPDIALVNEMIEWRIQNPVAQDEDIPPVPVVIAQPAEIVAEPDWQTTARSLAVIVATIVVIALAIFVVVLIGKEMFEPMVNRFEPNQFFTEINDFSYAY